MSRDYSYANWWFVPLDAAAPKFFGFSEFLTGLAFMVLAWMIADVRYRFRVRTTPFPLLRFTFWVVALLGILTLLTDLWRAEVWLFPRGLSLAIWQVLLGGLFLGTFLTWAWYAFIRRPIYSKRNAKRYAESLYQAILNGSHSELSVIADEFKYSVKALVRYATQMGRLGIPMENKEELLARRSAVTAYADEIFLMIGDKRFCRAIVKSSPGTALALFNEIGETEKYGIQVGIFARNIVNEAIVNKDSFLFHEAEDYRSGLTGYSKPLSRAMFSNHSMVEAIGTLLDIDVLEQRRMDAAQWKVYCKIVLMTFRDHVERSFWQHSFVLDRAMDSIEQIAADLYTIDGISKSVWDSDVLARLRVVVEFIKDAIGILENVGVPENLPLRIRRESPQRTPYDYLAKMIFEVIFQASMVQSPADLSWSIQHNTVWFELFNFNHLNGPAAKAVKFKVRRRIYDEVACMNEFPNFKGAKILAFCLSVMGLTIKDNVYYKDSKALQKAILSWTKKNYVWLQSYNPVVAKACLVDGMTYEVDNMRLVKTHPANGLRLEPDYSYFELDPRQPIENG